MIPPAPRPESPVPRHLAAGRSPSRSVDLVRAVEGTGRREER